MNRLSSDRGNGEILLIYMVSASSFKMPFHSKLIYFLRNIFIRKLAYTYYMKWFF